MGHKASGGRGGIGWGTTTFERIKMPEPPCCLVPWGRFLLLYIHFICSQDVPITLRRPRTHTQIRASVCLSVCVCIVFQVSHVRIELNLQQNVAKGGCHTEAVYVCVSVSVQDYFLYFPCACVCVHVCVCVLHNFLLILGTLLPWEDLWRDFLFYYWH